MRSTAKTESYVGRRAPTNIPGPVHPVRNSLHFALPGDACWSSRHQACGNRPRSARRVRKLGRDRFAGELCRSSGGVTSGSGGRRHADDGRSTRLPDGLEWQTRSAERLRLRRAEHLLGGEPQQRRGGRALARGHGEITGQRSRTRLESLSAGRRSAKLRPKCRRHGFRISLKIHYDRVYEP